MNPLIQYGAAAVVLIAAAGGLVMVEGELPIAEQESTDTVTTFSSGSEFREYLERAPQRTGGSTFTTGTRQMSSTTAEADVADAGGAGGATATSPERHSSTNVQEQGIDEPDIVKTDGEHIFYAREQWRRIMYEPQRDTVTGDVGSRYIPSRERVSQTDIYNTLPATNISRQSQINTSGELLLHEDTLIVLDGDTVTGYDVSTPSAPEESWEMAVNGSIVTARETGGTLYLVTRDRIDTADPCPVRPMAREAGAATVIPCNRIYHPVDPAVTDTTYTVAAVDAASGTVQDTTSVVGSSRHSVVYMSENGIYLTYFRQKSRSDVFMDFLLTDGRDMIDEQTAERLEEIDGYDISSRSKMRELERALENWQQSLSEEEKDELEETFRDRLGNYTKKHLRDLSQTGIVRVDTGDTLSVAASGEVPGRTLNQFSMDVYDGNVRIATTVGDAFGLRQQSENDVYVLDKQLDRVGSVTGMGVSQRVYAVRFIEDRGYVVTFRRIDPFHVLDLSDPSNPTEEGELELPGYSSYLHPVGDHRILGIGEENRKVKAVMFDVSDPANPTIADQTILDDYHSEIAQTHHAFLMDRKHKVFFLPGSNTGYIFSYEDGIEKVKTVETSNVKRAIYVNDYLYIFSDTEIVVVDEQTWDVTNRVSLTDG